MKLIKSAFALAAGAALLASSAAQSAAQADTIPLAVSLTASFTNPGGDTKPVYNTAITSASLVSKTASTLAVSLPTGSKLAVDNDGALVIADASGAVVIDLSYGTNTDTYCTTNITKGVNGSLNTNVTCVDRAVWLSDSLNQYYYGASGNYNYQWFAFWDTQWAGTFTDFDTFKVSGKAVAGGDEDQAMYLNFYVRTMRYTLNATGYHTTGTDYATCCIELCDASKATVSSTLSGGVYTIGFSIVDSGLIYTYDNRAGNFGMTGLVAGTLSASGKQTGGTSFLDPFNGNGNFYTNF